MALSSRFLGASVLAAGLSVVAAPAQDTTFVIEPDAEGRAAYAAFYAAFDEAGVFTRWDVDQDGMLTREEFNRGVFGTYDVDVDEYLNPDETAALLEDWDAPTKAGLHGMEAEAAEETPE